MNTVNKSITHLGEFFQNFKRRSLDDFLKYKMSMELYNEKCSSNLSYFDLHTTDGESVLKRIAFLVFISDGNQIKSRSLHKRKPPPFETVFY